MTENKVLFHGLTEDGNAGDKSVTPQPAVFKDGREFEASERFQVAFNDDENTLALVFQHVKPEDAGIYTCVASTFSGKISCSAELTVQVEVRTRGRGGAYAVGSELEGVTPWGRIWLTKPRMTLALTVLPQCPPTRVCSSSFAFVYPQPLFFPPVPPTCFTRWSCPYLVVVLETLEWIRALGVSWQGASDQAGTASGASLGDVTRSKPAIFNVWCCIGASAGSMVRARVDMCFNAVVTGAVNYREPTAPTIETNMEDVEVNEGASAMLELKITGWPKPRIVWLIGQTGHRNRPVWASASANQSSPVLVQELNSIPPPPSTCYSLTIRFRTVIVTKGEKLIESGYGGKYKFLFEDDESMTLVIRSVTKEDAGKYDVVAENELGSASTHCNLHVKCPPKFKKELKDASVMTEKPLKLDVEIEGLPEPDVKWYTFLMAILYKDGQQVTSTERVKLVHELDSACYALVVDKAKVEDAGSYTCVIANSLGSQSGHAAVTVNCEPSFRFEWGALFS
ncbi:muscle M-line assembly protein unc-89-like [Tropilaelaps mercedesae]|uniref:Muscle M-line assembly protein unc-89-like n=1 Tax=Tropilaelaps mercedesae TaxID=418985 RepID=A0A1V9WZP9_9ACAR|nr:muscle M-line assembly protein unc-89-like [Tropilaelaps mercedesae]